MTDENTQSPEKGLEEFCEDETGALPERTAEEIAKLEDDLQNERNSRKEERLYWILSLVIAVDMAVFPWLEAGQTVMVFLLELILLVPVAKHLGVDWVVEALNTLFSKMLDKIPLSGK